MLILFLRIHRLRHPHDHAPSVAGGVHRGHHRALPRHNQPFHRDSQDFGQN